MAAGQLEPPVHLRVELSFRETRQLRQRLLEVLPVLRRSKLGRHAAVVEIMGYHLVENREELVCAVRRCHPQFHGLRFVHPQE